jgi:hypothetical protein
MKTILIMLLAMSCSGLAEEKEKVSIRDFEKSKVLLGKLGKPFGTTMRVTCRGVAKPEGESGRTKDAWWEEVVEITAIEGKPLNRPVMIDWGTYREAVEKPAAGVSLEVFGYESGGFEGTPAGISVSTAISADVGFAFVCRFVAIEAGRKASKQK